MDQPVTSTSAEETRKHNDAFFAINPETESCLSELLRFAVREIESNIERGRVLQQEINQQRLLINQALARLMAS